MKHATLPARFNYLRAAALTYGVDEIQADTTRNEYVTSLGPTDVAQLAAVYREIREREDDAEISAWLGSVSLAHRGGREYRALWLLFVLFEALASRGIEPFSSREMRLRSGPHIPLNWSKLPRQVRYLASPAERFGRVQFENDIKRFAATVTEAELDEMRAIASKAQEDMQVIMDWIQRTALSPTPKQDSSISLWP